MFSFLAGLFIGTFIGFVVAALCHSASSYSRDYEGYSMSEDANLVDWKRN